MSQTSHPIGGFGRHIIEKFEAMEQKEFRKIPISYIQEIYEKQSINLQEINQKNKAIVPKTQAQSTLAQSYSVTTTSTQSPQGSPNQHRQNLSESQQFQPSRSPQTMLWNYKNSPRSSLTKSSSSQQTTKNLPCQSSSSFHSPVAVRREISKSEIGTIFPQINKAPSFEQQQSPSGLLNRQTLHDSHTNTTTSFNYSQQQVVHSQQSERCNTTTLTSGSNHFIGSSSSSNNYGQLKVLNKGFLQQKEMIASGRMSYSLSQQFFRSQIQGAKRFKVAEEDNTFNGNTKYLKQNNSKSLRDELNMQFESKKATSSMLATRKDSNNNMGSLECPSNAVVVDDDSGFVVQVNPIVSNLSKLHLTQNNYMSKRDDSKQNLKIHTNIKTESTNSMNNNNMIIIDESLKQEHADHAFETKFSIKQSKNNYVATQQQQQQHQHMQTQNQLTPKQHSSSAQKSKNASPPGNHNLVRMSSSFIRKSDSPIMIKKKIRINVSAYSIDRTSSGLDEINSSSHKDRIKIAILSPNSPFSSLETKSLFERQSSKESPPTFDEYMHHLDEMKLKENEGKKEETAGNILDAMFSPRQRKKSFRGEIAANSTELKTPQVKHLFEEQQKLITQNRRNMEVRLYERGKTEKNDTLLLPIPGSSWQNSGSSDSHFLSPSENSPRPHSSDHLSSSSKHNNASNEKLKLSPRGQQQQQQQQSSLKGALPPGKSPINKLQLEEHLLVRRSSKSNRGGASPTQHATEQSPSSPAQLGSFTDVIESQNAISEQQQPTKKSSERSPTSHNSYNSPINASRFSKMASIQTKNNNNNNNYNQMQNGMTNHSRSSSSSSNSNNSDSSENSSPKMTPDSKQNIIFNFKDTSSKLSNPQIHSDKQQQYHSEESLRQQQQQLFSEEQNSNVQRPSINLISPSQQKQQQTPGKLSLLIVSQDGNAGITTTANSAVSPSPVSNAFKRSQYLNKNASQPRQSVMDFSKKNNNIESKAMLSRKQLSQSSELEIDGISLQKGVVTISNELESIFDVHILGPIKQSQAFQALLAKHSIDFIQFSEFYKKFLRFVFVSEGRQTDMHTFASLKVHPDIFEELVHNFFIESLRKLNYNLRSIEQIVEQIEKVKQYFQEGSLFDELGGSSGIHSMVADCVSEIKARLPMRVSDSETIIASLSRILSAICTRERMFLASEYQSICFTNSLHAYSHSHFASEIAQELKIFNEFNHVDFFSLKMIVWSYLNSRKYRRKTVLRLMEQLELARFHISPTLSMQNLFDDTKQFKEIVGDLMWKLSGDIGLSAIFNNNNEFIVEFAHSVILHSVYKLPSRFDVSFLMHSIQNDISSEQVASLATIISEIVLYRGLGEKFALNASASFYKFARKARIAKYAINEIGGEFFIEKLIVEIDNIMRSDENLNTFLQKFPEDTNGLTLAKSEIEEHSNKKSKNTAQINGLSVLQFILISLLSEHDCYNAMDVLSILPALEMSSTTPIQWKFAIQYSLSNLRVPQILAKEIIADVAKEFAFIYKGTQNEHFIQLLMSD